MKNYELVKRHGTVKFEPPLKVEIDRGQWTGASYGRAENTATSLLVSSRYSNYDHMCCQGALLRAMGIGDAALLGRGMPTAVLHSRKTRLFFLQLVRFGTMSSQSLEVRLAQLNDSDCIGLPEKEKRISKLGAEFGVEFSFYGEA